jgi:hypothetical protein
MQEFALQNLGIALHPSSYWIVPEVPSTSSILCFSLELVSKHCLHIGMAAILRHCVLPL